jgi:hypothetical protein
MSYGINYRGNKNRIIKDIISAIIKETGCDKNDEEVIFYDLFGGGFAVSHYVLKNTKWKVVYNEPNNFIADFLKEFLINKRPVPYDYVDRDTFKKAVELTEPTEDFPAWRIGFIRSIFSFGGDLNSFIYGTDIEEKKRKWHKDIINNTNYKISSIEDKKKIRLEYMSKQPKYYSQSHRKEELQQLERLERLEQLQRLQQLERLERLEFYKKSFDEINILGKKILVYCDPPYINTNGYGKEKTTQELHSKLYNFFQKSFFPVFVSEYNFPFGEIIWSKTKGVNGGSGGIVKNATENLYYNKKPVKKPL